MWSTETVTQVFERAIRAAREGQVVIPSSDLADIKLDERQGDKPTLVIIGGVNGAGKTTLANGLSYTKDLVLANPDSRTQYFLNQKPEEGLDKANLEAVVEAERKLREALSRGQNAGIETVLSTDKYLPVVEQAKKLGYQFRFIYIGLASREVSAKRVSIRVSRGGHDVHPLKLWSRWDKSWDNMVKFAKMADKAEILANLDRDDNRAPGELVAFKENGQWVRTAEGRLVELDQRWAELS